jgi:hypothetical protein
MTSMTPTMGRGGWLRMAVAGARGFLLAKGSRGPSPRSASQAHLGPSPTASTTAGRSSAAGANTTRGRLVSVLPSPPGRALDHRTGEAAAAVIGLYARNSAIA